MTILVKSFESRITISTYRAPTIFRMAISFVRDVAVYTERPKSPIQATTMLSDEKRLMIFTSLGYPTYIIYPLTIAKLLGIIAIWYNKSGTLKEWAYAGFFFDFMLAMVAEIHADDGEYFSSVIATIALLTSYNISKKSIPKPIL
jgi:hypothetical protein